MPESDRKVIENVAQALRDGDIVWDLAEVNVADNGVTTVREDYVVHGHTRRYRITARTCRRSLGWEWGLLPRKEWVSEGNSSLRPRWKWGPLLPRDSSLDVRYPDGTTHVISAVVGSRPSKEISRIVLQGVGERIDMVQSGKAQTPPGAEYGVF